MPTRKRDLSSKVFERLTVLSRCDSEVSSDMWNCVCECGTTKVVKGGNLVTGNVKSCGCLRKEKSTKHGMYKERFYLIWSNMHARCRNRNSRSYGGRGISVCEEWESFENFKADLFPSYSVHCDNFSEVNTTIDRIDVDGDYEITNVRWATKKEQIANRRLGRNNISGHVGVSWAESRKKWRSRMHDVSKDHHIGYFDSLEEAIEARESFIKQIRKGAI